MSSVRKAFAAGQSRLSRLGLIAYDPAKNPEKAEAGEFKSGLQFLGCEIRPGFVRPSKGSRKRLLDSIEALFAKSASSMAEPHRLADAKLSLVETLRKANNVIKGWGNQYAFCNDRELMGALDSKINPLIDRYLDSYIKRRDGTDKANYNKERRRLMGIHLLTDSKRDPIIW